MKISLLADVKHEAAVIAQWYYQEWGRDDSGGGVDSITAKLILGANQRELPLCYVMHIGTELVGAGEIKLRKLADFPDYNYWLDGIFVTPKHRGKGISNRLIGFGIEKAMEFEATNLYLRCTQKNVKLYEAFGFNTVDTVEEKIIMEKQLNNSFI